MKIKGKQTVEVEIDEKELAYAIMDFMRKKFKIDVDDAGCDWFTKCGCTFIGDRDWLISDKPEVASLVDAMNILRYGKSLLLP